MHRAVLRTTALIAMSSTAFGYAIAQSSLPAGITIPVMLSTTLRSQNNTGKKISARVMQDVPLPDGGKIPRGSTISGTSIASSPKQIAITFDHVQFNRQEIPLRTSLRAIASMSAVQDAQLPTNTSGDRGSPPSVWNTVQIGRGDVVYGRPGNVYNGNRRVGKSLGDGSIFANLQATGECEGDPNKLQAVWVFSSSACGAYGFNDVNVAHDGQTNPTGQIVLRSSGPFEIRAGSGLLLRVVGQ